MHEEEMDREFEKYCDENEEREKRQNESPAGRGSGAGKGMQGERHTDRVRYRR